MATRHKSYDRIKQTYLDHAEDENVLRKLSPSHIVGIKKMEIEERRLKIAEDALQKAILARMLGGRDVVEGEVVDDARRLAAKTSGSDKPK